MSARRSADPFAATRKAMSDPIRLRMREQLAIRPSTMKALGGVLGIEPNRLYYHARILEAADLIEVVGAEPSGRSAERVYAAKRGSFGNELPGEDPVEQTVFIGAVLDATKAELSDLAFVKAAKTAADPPVKSIVLRAAVVTTAAGFDDFVEKIQRLVEAVSSDAMRLGEQGGLEAMATAGMRPFALTIAAYEHPDVAWSATDTSTT
jgi:DNA-binding transcriptional ArsR family regulator